MNLSYASLLDQVKSYDPSSYHSTRNFTNGAVTAWSPYISRGFLSPVLVMEILKGKYSKQAWIGFMQQMAWREYFQRVWQEKGDLILQDLKTPQANPILQQAPHALTNASTGIQAIDTAICQLYEKGYLHNHLRMYIAMLHTNIFKAAWLPGAKWMYAHLLDHDPAANFLSWQWVAGTSSSKQYVANQENINKYTNTKQAGTFLDTEYEQLPEAIFDTRGNIKSNIEEDWRRTLDQEIEMNGIQILEQLKQANALANFNAEQLDTNLPYCIYNSFNLDPLWHAAEKVNRILLLEPNHYAKFPITEKVLQSIIDLAVANIEGLHIYIGNFETLIQDIGSAKNQTPVVYFKEHPSAAHYHGIQEQRGWLFPEVTGYYPSFFGYWKKCEKYLK